MSGINDDVDGSEVQTTSGEEESYRPLKVGIVQFFLSFTFAILLIITFHLEKRRMKIIKHGKNDLTSSDEGTVKAKVLLYVPFILMLQLI